VRAGRDLSWLASSDRRVVVAAFLALEPEARRGVLDSLALGRAWIGEFLEAADRAEWEELSGANTRAVEPDGDRTR
jgi:hypothetical protein